MTYSEGFNPRPKMSLALPRSVGTETDDDLLSLRVRTEKDSSKPEELKYRLSKQLPEGIDLTEVSIADTKKSFNSGLATYLLILKPDYAGKDLKTKIEKILSTSHINVERSLDSKGKTRNVDVRKFLKSIKLEDTKISVNCRFGQSGTIRVEEILKILELDMTKLAVPIRRTNIQWNEN